MSTFCKYCGATLENNQLCNCQDAVAERSSATQAPPPYAPDQQQPPQYGQQPPQYGQQPPQYGQQPLQYGQQPPQYGQPYQPVQPNPSMDAAKGILNEVKGIFMSSGKDPTGVAKNSGEISFAASLTILGAEVLTLFLLVWSICAKLAASINKQMGGWGVNFKMPGEVYVNTLVSGIVGIALLFGCLFVFGKLFKSELEAKGLLSCMAVSSIPKIAYNLIMVLFFLIFNIEKFIANDGLSSSVYLFIMITVFFTLMSYFMLETSMRRLVPNKTNNVLIISISYAVYSGIGMFFMFESMTSTMKTLSYMF